MQKIIHGWVASAVISVTAFAAPAWAEREIQLNIPVRVDGDLSKVTDGIWLYCHAYVSGDESVFNTSWSSQISAPGTTFAPNAPDGTFLTTITFVPSDLGENLDLYHEYGYFVDIHCNLQRGASIPREQLKAGDIERTSRRDASGYPTAPAGPGSCGALYISFKMPEHSMQRPPKLKSCL